LSPIQQTGLPVLGVISDAQESIRLAVAAIFPRVPHQICQYHALREAAEPLWEADRHLLVEAKKELRGFREVEERTRQAEPSVAPSGEKATDAASEERRRPAAPVGAPEKADAPDSANAVVLDTVLALRQIVRERGVLPFDFAGLRVLESLDALGATLDRCLEKKGTPAWLGCGP
jgi:hypothetical protein